MNSAWKNRNGIYPPGKFFGGSGRRYRGAVPGLPVRDEVTQFADADAAVCDYRDHGYAQGLGQCGGVEAAAAAA